MHRLKHSLNWAQISKRQISTSRWENGRNYKNPDRQNPTKRLNGTLCLSGRKKDKIPYDYPKCGRYETEEEAHWRHLYAKLSNRLFMVDDIHTIP